MALKTFEAQNLKWIDNGAFAEQVNHHIEMQVSDCKARAGDERPRTVTVSFTFIPIPNGKGQLHTIDSQCQVTSKSPYHKSNPIQLGIDREGKAVFNEHFMDAVDQTSLLDDDAA